MVVPVDKPVTANLSQAARMNRRERSRVVRRLRASYPEFHSLLRRVSVARGVAFGASLALAAAVVVLVRGASASVVALLIFSGLAGFGYVAVALTDTRFDVLLAVIGAHRFNPRLEDEQWGSVVVEDVDDAAGMSCGASSASSAPCSPEVEAAESVVAVPEQSGLHLHR